MRACEAVLWALFQKRRTLTLRRPTRCHLLESRLSAHSTRHGKNKNSASRVAWHVCAGKLSLAQPHTPFSATSFPCLLPLAPGPPLVLRHEELNAGSLTSSSAHPDPVMGKTPGRLRIPNLGNGGGFQCHIKRLIREDLQKSKGKSESHHLYLGVCDWMTQPPSQPTDAAIDITMLPLCFRHTIGNDRLVCAPFPSRVMPC